MMMTMTMTMTMQRCEEMVGRGRARQAYGMDWRRAWTLTRSNKSGAVLDEEGNLYLVNCTRKVDIARCAIYHRVAYPCMRITATAMLMEDNAAG